MQPHPGQDAAAKCRLGDDALPPFIRIHRRRRPARRSVDRAKRKAILIEPAVEDVGIAHGEWLVRVEEVAQAVQDDAAGKRFDAAKPVRPMPNYERRAALDRPRSERTHEVSWLFAVVARLVAVQGDG